MNKIQKKICREELKSRIPALFAYIEENEAGEFRLHKATDSLQGCYGHIIESIKLPEGVNLVIEGETILESGKIYSYRTLIDYYYEYKENADLPFIVFIDKAIGKIKIDFEELELDETENDMVPHYIYLANVRKLFNQYSKLKTVYDYYTGGDDDFDINILEDDICCLCNKYRRMGGTKMYVWLKNLFTKANTIADEYYGYAQKDKLTLNLNVNLNQSIHDIGYLSCYLNDWVGGDTHFKGELYTYNGRTYICNEDNNDIYDEKTMTFVFDDSKFSLRPQDKLIPDGGTDYVLTGNADSKLKSLRRFREYISGDDKKEVPDNGEDWLYYYREGAVVNYTTVNDEFGNIANMDNLNEPAGNDGDKLAAYGNVIDKITADAESKTITFVYYINAHLKANCIGTDKDDDGNVLYIYDEFYLDKNDKYHGVKYTETYNYEEGGELDYLISPPEEVTNSFTFEQYVKDKEDRYTTFKKYAFNTSGLASYYDKELYNQIVTVPYIKTDYEAIIENKTDYLFADVFKTDYLNEITYKPIVENDVRIDRGNYAAFERHLKLAEVKTMEDMENYTNNSFFNIQKVN